MVAKKQARRKWTRSSHRWLGMFLLVPLVVASLTGVLLNHTVDLKLNERYVTASWVQSRYGMELNGEPEAYGVEKVLAGQWDGHLFYQDKIWNSAELLKAAVPLRDGVAVVTENTVYYYGLDGELIETLDELTLPQESIVRAGCTDDLNLVLETQTGMWVSDADLLNFIELKEGEGIQWSRQMETDETNRVQWERSFFGEGVPMDRVILDIHSGRFFGTIGKWVWDILVIGILILSASGFVLFFRKKNRKS